MKHINNLQKTETYTGSKTHVLLYSWRWSKKTDEWYLVGVLHCFKTLKGFVGLKCYDIEIVMTKISPYQNAHY